MTVPFHNVVKTAALAAAVAVFAVPAHAQDRLSLAERVARLEQQQANPAQNGSVDLVNQIQALQSQVQSLQGQVEELQHALDEANQRNKQQYLDIDSRVGRLEGNPSGTPNGAAAAPPRGGRRGRGENLGRRRVRHRPAPLESMVCLRAVIR